MRRLTEANEQGYWNIKGLPWKNLYAGQVITEETRKIIYVCLCKLKDYEDIGPSPEQLKKIDELFSEVCKEVGQLKQKVNDAGWIPVEQRLPETDDYILLSFANISLPQIGRYEETDDGGGAFYIGDDGKSLISYGLFVDAWMPLPDPYRPEE